MFFAFAQGAFGRLAVGDVLDGADHPVARGVVCGDRVDVPHRAVGGAADAELLVVGLAPLHHVPKRPVQPVPVFRQRDRLHLLDGPVAAVDAVDAAGLVRRGHGAGVEVEAPGADLRDRLGAAEFGLAVAERLGGGVLLGDVAEDQHHAAGHVVVVPDGRGAVGDLPLGPVARNEKSVVRQAHDPSGGEHLADRVLDRLARLGVDDLEGFFERPADGLGQRPAGQGLGHGVHFPDPAVDVGGDDGVADGVERGAVILFAPAEGGLGLLAPGHDLEIDRDAVFLRVDRNLVPVFVGRDGEVDLEALPLLLFQRAAVVLLEHRTARLWKRIEEGPAHDLVPRSPEEALGGGVEIGDHQVPVEAEKAVADAFERRFQARLGLLDSLFGALALGDVHPDGPGVPLGKGEGRRQVGPDDGPFASVFRLERDLLVTEDAAGRLPFFGQAFPVRRIGVEPRHPVGIAHHLVLAVAGHLFAGPVPEGEGSRLGNGVDEDGHVLGQRTETRFAVAQRGVGALAVGDVEHHPLEGDDFAGRVPVHRGAIIHPVDRPVLRPDAVFLAELGLAAFGVAAHLAAHALQIVGVDDGGIRHAPGKKVFRCVPEALDVLADILHRPVRCSAPAEEHGGTVFDDAARPLHPLTEAMPLHDMPQALGDGVEEGAFLGQERPLVGGGAGVGVRHAHLAGIRPVDPDGAALMVETAVFAGLPAIRVGTILHSVQEDARPGGLRVPPGDGNEVGHALQDRGKGCAALDQARKPVEAVELLDALLEPALGIPKANDQGLRIAQHGVDLTGADRRQHPLGAPAALQQLLVGRLVFGHGPVPSAWGKQAQRASRSLRLP